MSSAEQENPILALLPMAGATLAAALGESARLEPGDVLDGRPHVMRCPVVTSLVDAPATVIVKSAHNPHRPAYDPENLESGSPATLFLKDWIGVEFLDSCASPDVPRFSPRFYGGDRARGYFLMEDLGAGESMATLLLGNDPQRAEDGLLTYAATLGRMHAATLPRKETFDALCASLGFAPEKRENSTQRRGVDEEKWNRLCDALEITPTPGTEEDIAAVQAVISESGPFLAYTHGDPCPDNNRLMGGEMFLFDFEHGGFRHALMDGIYGRVPFPTCWCVNRLPEGLPLRMEELYRAELAKTCPEAADDLRFQQESLTVWGGWLLNTLFWSLEAAITQDHTWGISSIRQRYLFRTRLFAEETRARGCLTSLGETVGNMAVRLEAMWGAELEPMPLYPAFR